MRRTCLSLVLLFSALSAKTAIAQEATDVAPGAPIPPPPPAPPPPPPQPEVVYVQPPAPSPPPREVVVAPEPRSHHHEHEHEARAHGQDGFSFGLELNSFQFDFGFGARITSPSIAHFIRFSAGGGAAWIPNALELTQPTQDTWASYYYGRLTLEILGPQLGFVRTYAFAGAILLGVPSDISKTEINIGGMGGFGFEFEISRYSSYYIELGALGTGATGDQLVDSPTFANGFLISVGSRFYP
jgi:hypothetical protein